MLRPQIPIALEGYPFILFSAFTTLIVAILGYDSATLLFLLTTSFVLYFFRDPERTIPAEPDTIVSPADGKIILIDKVIDERFSQKEMVKISIFMNVFNVHVNRIPIAGKVDRITYLPGKFYSADSERGALQNEKCAVFLDTELGEKIIFVQVAGLIARRIVCWLEPGDTVQKGKRFGLIRFGSRVDVYLPVDVKIDVTVGQKTKAGETVLGQVASQ